MKPTIKTAERLSAICDALWYAYDWNIEDEKDFDYSITEVTENHFTVHLSYVRAFNEPIFKGDRLQPEDDLIPLYDKQVIYVSSNTTIKKFVKDFMQEIEIIEDKKCPELEYE